MIWNTAETGTRKEIEALQLLRLRWQVEYSYDHVPFYRSAFDAAGLKPIHIQSLSDLAKIPFTVKNDLRDQYPTGLFAVPNNKIVRYHASSGTTGKPIVVGYTRNDMENWTECCARMAAAAGVTAEDTAQVAFGYGLFTGGFGLHYGLERVGASVIPISSGNSERQLMFMKDLHTTVLVATPSYVLHLTEVMEDMGITKEDLFLRTGMFGGEGHTPEMRRQIESRLNINDTQNYGLTELCGPGLSYECLKHTGMHINEDFFITEIIDPKTGEVLPEGSTGEIVVTTLTKEGIPMLRYRTKDITRIEYGQCSCGRTFARMDLVKGRTDDMMIIRGVNVFPSQIEAVMLTYSEVEPHYVIMVDRVNNLDRMTVKVEMTSSFFSDSIKEIEHTERRMAEDIASITGIHAKITLCEPRSLPRSEGKIKRVFDQRFTT